MIAVDTNVLVHAHRRESTVHAEARQADAALGESASAWVVPWPCVHAFGSADRDLDRSPKLTVRNPLAG